MARRSKSIVRRTSDFWTDWAAAATTIAARAPILYEAAVTGSPKALVESQRMVTEKALAAAEGMASAGAACMNLWVRMAFGSVKPHRVMEDVAKVAEAAARPASKACRANAKRLSRKRRKR